MSVYENLEARNLYSKMESFVLKYFEQNGSLPDYFLRLLDSYIKKLVDQDLNSLLSKNYEGDVTIIVSRRTYDAQVICNMLLALDPVLANKVFEVESDFLGHVSVNVLDQRLFNVLYDTVLSYYNKHFNEKISYHGFTVVSNTQKIFLVGKVDDELVPKKEFEGNFLVMRKVSKNNIR